MKSFPNSQMCAIINPMRVLTLIRFWVRRFGVVQYEQTRDGDR